MESKVLIVEDDTDINNVIREALEKEGFLCQQAFSGTEALLLLKEEDFQVIIMDLMLPGLPGEELLLEIRKKKDTPVLVLSAKDQMESKVGLLTSGANDYMTKPFALEELLARVHILNRQSHGGSQDHILAYKDLRLNQEDFSCYVGEERLDLTKTEWKILELFLLYPKRVFSKKDIYEHSRDDYYLGDDSAINVHISNLRKKLSLLGREDYIQTVWGIGYKLKD